MVGKIILGAVEFVPDVVSKKENFTNILDTPLPKLFDLGGWLADGIKAAVLNLTEWIVNGIIEVSYWGCMIVGLTAILLYIAGFKESKKYICGSIVVYIILQILKVAIASVK